MVRIDGVELRRLVGTAARTGVPSRSDGAFIVPGEESAATHAAGVAESEENGFAVAGGEEDEEAEAVHAAGGTTGMTTLFHDSATVTVDVTLTRIPPSRRCEEWQVALCMSAVDMRRAVLAQTARERVTQWLTRTGTLEVDAEGTVMYCSESLRRVLGYTGAAEVEGKSCSTLLMRGRGALLQHIQRAQRRSALERERALIAHPGAATVVHNMKSITNSSNDVSMLPSVGSTHVNPSLTTRSSAEAAVPYTVTLRRGTAAGPGASEAGVVMEGEVAALTREEDGAVMSVMAELRLPPTPRRLWRR